MERIAHPNRKGPYNMKGIHIVATGRAVPKKVVTNDDLSKFVDTNDEWITTRTGIRERHFSTDELNYELAAKAGKIAMEKARILPTQIAGIIVATVTPDYIMPSTACMVQKKLGIPMDCMAFDINAACSGFIYGLRICKGLLENMEKPYMLLIGSEQMSKILDFTDRSTCVLFGDGAGAAIIELSEKHSYYQRTWSDGNEEALTCLGPGKDNAKLLMDGKAVFRFAVNAVKEGIDAVLADADLDIEDIDFIVCHQANARIIEHVRKKYDLPQEMFFMNLQKYANTSAASIPIAIDEMIEQGMLKEGMKIICVGFGAGFTWTGALLTF